MNEWIVIKGWDEFQHVDVKRGTGPPPWIKNYVRLLQDDDYMALSPVRALMLHRLWLAYAQSRASLRADTLLLNRRLGLRVRQSDIEALVQAGFITLSASKPQAARVQDAGTTRVREEVEEEVEESTTPSSALSSTSRSEETARESAAPKAPPHAFVCSFAYEHGPCGIEFKTEEALQAHQANVHTQLNGAPAARAQSPREALLLDKREIPF